MKKPNKKTENKFTRTSIPIARMMRWWKGQSSENDKGGTFNLDHYIRVSEVLNQATLHKV